MIAALTLARRYGVSVRFADLGDWGLDELRSEYDASVPEIRLNVRIAEALTLEELGDFVARAIGHELYHHREQIGEVVTLQDRKARELAANEFARELMERNA